MKPSPKRNDSNHVMDIDPSDEEERFPCCPLDPPDRAEPTPPLLKHPRKTRSPQSRREFYQNQFPPEP